MKFPKRLQVQLVSRTMLKNMSNTEGLCPTIIRPQPAGINLHHYPYAITRLHTL